MPLALIVEDEEGARRALSELVELEGFRTLPAEDLKRARRLLDEHRFDVVLTDLALPDGKGTELLAELDDTGDVDVILITGRATVETAVDALRLGAYDYLTKPVDLSRLRSLLNQLRRSARMRREITSLRSELRQMGRFGKMIGASEPMRRVYELIERVAPTDASVFVLGESGTGKELVAQSIHRLSRRGEEKFVPLNCGAITPGLLESELFGHEKGSFTGASRRHHGYFERAHGGTLFLDEITEMPIELQVKLLRVLETSTVQRVGGIEPVAVDVRVVAATNRDPERAVADNRLREDLLYRLKVFPIALPPLRQRPGDVELLTEEFLKALVRKEGRRVRLTREAVELLTAYHWPGNVRELKNVVYRCFILADEAIDADLLPPELRGEVEPAGPDLRLRVGTTIAEAERRLILATLAEKNGNRKQTAATLGISVKTLYNRLTAYGEQDATDEA